MVNLPIWIPNGNSLSAALLDLFLSFGTFNCSSMASIVLNWKIMIMLLSQFLLTFPQTKGMFHFIT